jgi:hypothetical protein
MKRNLLGSAHSTWLADTFARNRALYAGWTMEDEPPAPKPAAPATPPEPPAPAAVATPPEPAPAEPTGNVWDDPAAARSEIEKLRRENAKDRTDAKTAAAEAARADLAQTIGKALGLVEDEQIDPAKLTESLTAAQMQAKQAQVALAVYQGAAQAGGDPAALLDSSSFLKSLDGLNPADSTAVTAAITAAVAANPRLGAAPSDPRIPAPNPAQGSSAGGAPDLDSQIADAQKAGDIKTAIHLQNQKLARTRA